MNKEQQLPAISKVFLHGPAWRAGIKTSDLILEIEGKATESKSLRDVVEQLRGEEGSKVTVVVRQPDAEESRTLIVTRGRVFIPTVEGHREISEGKWQYTVDSAKDVALLRVNSIGPSTLHELRQIESVLRQQQDVRGIILDLRNGGGLLHDTVMVADSLLDGGTIGFVRSLDSVKKYEANPGALFRDLPMVVLIGQIAGADRVFLTAALQDNDRAIVVGQATTNETYVNQFVSVPGRDESLRVATGVLQRGNGTPLRRNPRYVQFATRLEAANLQLVQSRPEARKRAPFIAPDHLVTAAGAYSPTDGMVDKALEVLRAEIKQRKSESQAVSG